MSKATLRTEHCPLIFFLSGKPYAKQAADELGGETCSVGRAKKRWGRAGKSLAMSWMAMGVAWVESSKSWGRAFDMYSSQLERQMHLTRQEPLLNTHHAKRSPNIRPYIFLTRACKYYPNGL